MGMVIDSNSVRLSICTIDPEQIKLQRNDLDFGCAPWSPTTRKLSVAKGILNFKDTGTARN